MNAFITGSHAYGTPTHGSDIDLVVLVDEETKKMLLNLKRVEGSHEDNVKVGGIDLIICTTQYVFDLWLVGTQALKSLGTPVKRDNACEYFKKLGLK